MDKKFQNCYNLLYIFPFDTVTNIAEILLGVIIPVFTFAVTLLRDTIRLAKERADEVQSNNVNKTKEKISDIENRIDEMHKQNDSSTETLEDQLDELKEIREKNNKDQKSIRRQYSYLGFWEAVVFPSLFFIAAIILSECGKLYATINGASIWTILLFVLSILGVVLGGYRITHTLRLIELVIASTKVDRDKELEDVKLEQIVKKMAGGIKSALLRYEEQKRKQETEKLEIKFISKLPYESSISKEVDIKFRVLLEQGRVLRDVSVWFFVPDEITMVVPTEGESWRQAEDYDLPSIKTVRVDFGNMSIGTATTKSLKIKTPSSLGIYKIYYRLFGEGYSSGVRESFDVIVK